MMIVLMVSVIGPYIYVFLVSVTNQSNIGNMFAPGTEFTLEAYRRIFTESNHLIRAFAVSIGRTVVGTTLNLLVTALVAYALSKTYLPGRKIMVLYMLITILFSGGLIPTFLLISSLGLIDNYLVYILPGLVSAWYVLLMRNFFMNLSESLEEAAKIDGASDWLVLFRIALPLSLPVMATLGLFYAINHWNSWFDAILYMRSAHKFPLQFYLRQLVIEDMGLEQLTGLGKDETAGVAITPDAIKNATILVATLPIVFVYPFVQKYFVKGIMVGAVKG
jgi:putative aldouronate transport system permease protein